MDKVKERAIILKKSPFEERHQLVSLFTESHGLVQALAHNSIQSRRFAGSLELFSASECSFTFKENRDMARLDEAVLLKTFENIRVDFSRLSVASMMSEMIVRVNPQGPGAGDLFKLLSHSFVLLDECLPNTTQTELKIANLFLAKFLQWLGHQPQIKSCYVCQKSISIITTPTILSSVSLAAWSCLDCHIENRKEIPKAVIEDLILSLGFNLRKGLSHLQGSPQESQELFSFLKGLCFFHIPGFDQRPIQSLRFLESSLAF
jgi:DNA repair protein RecO